MNIRNQYVLLYSTVDEMTLRTYDNLMSSLKTSGIQEYDVKLINVKKEPDWLFKYNILALPAIVQTAPAPGFIMTGDNAGCDFF